MVINTKPNNNLINQLVKDEPSIFALPKVGDVVEGIFLGKKSKMLVFDLGKYGTGAVYWNEAQNSKEIVKKLKPSIAVHAKIISVDNEDGLIELSLSEAGKQKSWSEVSELYEKEEILNVKPTSFNRGGLVAELNGLQAFLPVSQLSNDHYPKVSADEKSQISGILERLVGSEIKVKIIDVNPRTNKLIVSEKAAYEESAKELAKNYEVGQVVEGIVSGVADFGAFVKLVDNPLVEGLVHVSELDWLTVENPKEIINIDDAVKVKIIEIKDGRIYFSLKALKPDPWTGMENKYKEGDKVMGRVYSFNPFGAIINLQDGIQGQLHVSEFGGIEEMKSEIALGEERQFIIDSANVEERKIVLKLKNNI